jgi:pectate lyase
VTAFGLSPGRDPTEISGERGMNAPEADAGPSAQEAGDAGFERAVVPLGWASVAGLGVTTTSGGAAGRTVSANTPAELITFASSEEPLVIQISGTLRAPRVSVASNKTLRGVGAGAKLEGGLRIRGEAGAFVENVIVQNLNIDGASSEVDGDAIQVHYAHHVWIDHCDVRDAPDGNLDIVHGSDFVTVSWTRFSFSVGAVGERASTRVGHNDDAAPEDAEHLNVTFHDNFWDSGVVVALPSIRFGDVHIFGNYFASPGADLAISAGVGARVLVEDNYFDRFAVPHRLNGAGAELRADGNVYEGFTLVAEVEGAAFVPPYVYPRRDAGLVPTSVPTSAGARLD